jgi:hypothetical protein
MLQAKLVVPLLFFANLLGSGATYSLSTHEALETQREKCEAITEHCKCLEDGQSNSTCADTQLHNMTVGEIMSSMACDVTLGKCRGSLQIRVHVAARV